MSDESPQTQADDAPKARERSSSTKVAEDVQERYDLAGWKARARMSLGVSPHAVAGALHGQEVDAEFSEAEVRKALDKFAEVEGVEAEQ